MTITTDGEATLYLAAATVDGSLELLTVLLRRQRELHQMSLAAAVAAMGVKSRNGFAQYESARSEPSLRKFIDLLAAVAPEFVLAVIPRSARVIPRWEEERVNADELDAMLGDPSEANAAALRSKRQPRPATVERPVVPWEPPSVKPGPKKPDVVVGGDRGSKPARLPTQNIDASKASIQRSKPRRIG